MKQGTPLADVVPGVRVTSTMVQLVTVTVEREMGSHKESKSITVQARRERSLRDLAKEAFDSLNEQLLE